MKRTQSYLRGRKGNITNTFFQTYKKDMLQKDDKEKEP